MRRIIDGKLYDTSKAVLLGNRTESHPSDFHYCDESLYRTEKGTYFIAGEGGALSSYAGPIDNHGGRSGGEGLCVVCRDEARHWAEVYLEVEEYMKHFEAEEG